MQVVLNALTSFLTLSLLVHSINGAPHHTRTTAGNKNVIIEMFEWNWDSVAAECSSFIGPAGYGYVQVSPPQEHVQGPQWWTSYQAVSYTLTSKRGNRSQFQAMVSQCNAAGVGVIVDTLFNHMASDSGTGVAGSSFSHYNYPGTYQYQDFHQCGQPNNNIEDYNNRTEVQTCELEGLADLATEAEYVQSRLGQFGADLISLGVVGLRLDAAKHMAASNIANIISRLPGSSSLYVTQEVVWGGVVDPSEYVGNGEVQEFRYTSELKQAFEGGNIAELRDLDGNGWVTGSKANVFVANHDTERKDSSLNVSSPSNTYLTASIFSLAHTYGTPTVLSSYTGFDTNADAGAPNGGAGSCQQGSGYFCQHRWTAIVGMVGFRNTVGSADLCNWFSPQKSQIAFGRGSSGYVAINNDDAAWSATFVTSLADGVYCDVISGGVQGGSCKGARFTVSGGQLSATVPARNAIAIHIGSRM